MRRKVAVAGAGIYGTAIAIRLAEHGHDVRLFDPLGVLRAATAINQYRVHSGYHYPRSPETIQETMEARAEFLGTFAAAIVPGTCHYYAIPKEQSLTTPDLFESVMAEHHLPLRRCRPAWLDFGFIDACYQVAEKLYDPDVLREIVTARIESLRIPFEQREFLPAARDEYDLVIWATYGQGYSRCIFAGAKRQVAEKILVELPRELRGVSLMVLDGPFTGFDPCGNSGWFVFGSAKNTRHWESMDCEEAVPAEYARLLNGRSFERVAFTHFEAMRRDASLSAPAVKSAVYRGSRFAVRVVENNRKEDRRTLYLREGAPGELHVFSGKVVSAVKAARLVAEWVEKDG